MTHTALTARALVIGETLAVQVVAMRQQRIGGRSLVAHVTAAAVDAFYGGRAPLPAGVQDA